MKVQTLRRVLAPWAALILLGACAGPIDSKDPDPVKTLTSVSVSPSTLTLAVGEDSPLVAVVAHWSDGTTSVVADASWSSSLPSVATVSAGIVTGVAAGEAVVTATKSGKTAQIAVTVQEAVVGVDAPTALYLGGLTAFVDGTTPAKTETTMVSVNGVGSVELAATVGTGTFAGYPDWWDGMVGWVQRPKGSVGNYDLSGVTKVRFKIRSETIQASQLAYFVQWANTANTGGEYTVPLTTLGVTDLTVWNQVEVNVASGGAIPNTITTARYGYGITDFFTGAGNQNVDTALGIKWYGSAGSAPNSGPLVAGQDYEIGDIEFVDATGASVNIAAGITWPVVVGPASLYLTEGTPSLATGFDTWGSGTILDPAYTGDATYAKVIRLTGGDGWGTVVAFNGFPAGTLAGYSTLKFKVKTAFAELRVKVPEIEQGFAVSSGTALADGWVQMSVPLSGFGTTGVAGQFAIFAFGSGEILLTDVTLEP